jgi:hypothetical protein
MEADNLLLFVDQGQPNKIELDKRLQQTGKIVEEGGKLAVGGNRFRDIKQRLIPRTGYFRAGDGVLGHLRGGDSTSHPITATCAADLLQHGADQWRFAQQFHAGGVHLCKYYLTIGIDKIHVRKVHDGPATACGGAGRTPAELEFADPGTRQTALQIQAKFAGGVVKSDLEHGNTRAFSRTGAATVEMPHNSIGCWWVPKRCCPNSGMKAQYGPMGH